MGFRKQMGSLLVVLLSALTVSCADEGPVATDASYTLNCPSDQQIACGGRDAETCLRPTGGGEGARRILGVNGEISCDGINPVIARCQGSETVDGNLIITMESSVPADGGSTTAFGFQLNATVNTDGSAVTGNCEVTITEELAEYGGDAGNCGFDPPSAEQPCQLSNFVISDPGTGIDVRFDIECDSLLSNTVADTGFDVSGTIQYANCNGL